MLILIDNSEILLKRMKINGWKQNGGYAIRGNPSVLEKGNDRLIVVKPIRIDPFKVLKDEIDKFFESLKRIIGKLKSLGKNISGVYLPGGGTIPLPKWFSDFCKENGVEILIYNDENVLKIYK